MPAEEGSSVRFEIGHVLFVDIVEYSKLLIDEQKKRLRELTAVVLATAQVREADNEQLVRLPTGDGMALVFRNSSEEAVKCALEIAQALKGRPEIQVRMGVHSGPVSEVTDLNDRTNIAGAGINMAQRVMDCGDAGHILLSKHVADDLEQYRQWRPMLHHLGDCEVKHGLRLSLVSLYGNDIGNPAVPEKVGNFATAAAVAAASALPAKRGFLPWAFFSALVVLIAAGVAFYFFSHRTMSKMQATSSASPAGASNIPEKSIAVLPFENLSSDKENAYFADGIQEEILTRLSRIAGLKVISRTSTARYKSRPSDLPEIAKQLGVAQIVEGSVQRAADQVRVNVQLINARSDSHIWADSFDRKLTDLFAVETEIATRIADTLQAKLTEAEHTALAARPTENMVAHELYLKGRYFFAKRTHEDTLKAVDYYNQALAKDPDYAAAYAGLAESYAGLPVYSQVPAKEMYEKAKVAAERALALDRNLAEAHTSLGVVMVVTEFSFAEARGEFKRAIALNPNYAPARYSLAGLVLLPLGETEAAIVEVNRALELDPLSLPTRSRLGWCYIMQRRFPEAIDTFRKTIDLNPAYAQAQDALAIALGLSGDLDGAVAQFQKSFQASGGDFHSVLYSAHFYGRKGERDKALQAVERGKQLEAEKGAEWAYGYAVAYAGIGDKKQAIGWLERSYEARESVLLVDIKVDPLLASLRGEPRFEALAEKIVPASEFGATKTSK